VGCSWLYCPDTLNLLEVGYVTWSVKTRGSWIVERVGYGLDNRMGYQLAVGLSLLYIYI
jgi:hypothetical protein